MRDRALMIKEKNIMKKKIIATILSTTLALLVLAGCGSSQAASAPAAEPAKTEAAPAADEAKVEEAAPADEVKKVVIGIRQDLTPTSYIDENGNPAGYDVEIAKLIDEALPDYEFTYEAVSQDNLLLGLDTGKYAAGFAGYFWNEDRAAKYLFPEENIGASLSGFVTKKAHSDLKGYEDVYDQGLVLTPLAGTSGHYGIIQEYNETHPDKQVNLEVTEWKTDAEGYQWVLDDRYDICVAEITRYKAIKEQIDKDDELVYIPVNAIKTWTLFAQGQEDLVEKYDVAIKKLKDEGKLAELSVQFFEENVFDYVKE